MIIDIIYLKQLIASSPKFLFIQFHSNEIALMKFINCSFTFLFLALVPLNLSAQVSVNAVPSTYTQDFGTSPINSWTNNSTFLGWYNNVGTIVSEIDITVAVPPNGGGLYAYTCSGNNDRKIGFRPSNGSGGPSCSDQSCGHAIGLRIQNNSGEVINSIEIEFDIFQLSIAQDGGNVNTIHFDYQIAPSFGSVNLGVAGWTSVPDLQWSGPQLDPFPGGCSDQLQGLPCNFNDNLSACITVTINPGEEIMLRWTDPNNPCNDPHFAIDNINLEFSPSCTAPSLDMVMNAVECGSYTFPLITGSNLSGNQAYFTGPNGTGTQYNPGDQFTTIGTTTIYLYDSDAVSGCSPTSCSDELTFDITISPTPTITQLPNLTACPGEDISIVFASNPSGVLFEWTNTNTTIGAPASGMDMTGFDFTAADVTNTETGTITVTASLDGCESDPMVFDITVTPLTDLTDPLSPDNTFCNEGNSITLPNPVDGIPGTWMGTGVTGNEFDPQGLSAGNITLTFTPNTGSCADELDIPVIIEDASTPTFSPFDDICVSADPVDLPNISNNGIQGTWTFMGNPVTQFDPEGLSGSQTLLFTPINSECAIETNVNIMVEDAIPLTFSGIPTDLCSSSESINLPTTSNQGINVTWSGPGVSGNSFNPNGLNGAVEIIFTPTGGACALSDNIIINITATITPTFGNLGPFCENENSVTLPGTSNNGVAGTWSGPGVTGDVFDPSGLSGNLQLTFEPSGTNCASNALIPIIVNSAPDPTATSNSPICEGNDLELSALGGTSFSWSGPNLFTSDDQNPTITSVGSVNAGTYTVTVTNSGGCTAETSVSVVIANSFGLNSVITSEISCAGESDGAFSVNFTGTPALPFQSIMWSVPPGATLNGLGNFSNLPAGIYSLVVTDNNGCTAEASLALNEPDALFLTCTKLNDETAPLADDGTIQVEISGGISNYDITISNPGSSPFLNVSAGTYTFDNLPPGSYTITVTDDNGCTETCTRVINDAGCPTINIFTVDISSPSCHDAIDGSIEISVDGGSGILTYSWAPNPFGVNGPILTNLPADTYTLIVIDENGCESSPAIFDLTAPEELTISCAMESAASGDSQNDGVAFITVTGGTGFINVIDFSGPGNPINPILFPGDNLITDLLPGEYSLIIMDENGCEASCSFTIEANADCDLLVELDITQQIQCNGASDGIINTTVTNGSGSYTYAWSEPTIGNVANAINVGPGSYMVTVTDMNNPGCTATAAEVILTQPEMLDLTCEAEPTLTEGGSDGFITLTFTGGTAPYLILWSGPLNGTQNIDDPGQFVIENLPEGTYSIQIVDENECIQSCLSTVNSPGCNLTVNLNASPVSCNGGSDGSIQATVEDANGDVNFQWVVAPTPIPDGEANPTNLTEGVYTLLVTDENNCTVTVSTLVGSPNPLQFISCTSTGTLPDMDNGAIVINFIGGTGPFNIAFTTDDGFNLVVGQTNSGIFTENNLPAGIYTITVTDANGCMATCETTIELINENCDLDIDCSVLQQETGEDSNDGSAAIIIIPGNQEVTVTYEDQNGDLVSIGPIIIEDTLFITGLSPGDYTFIVSNDEENCEATCSLTILPFDPGCDLTIICDPANESAPDANDGSVTISISPENQIVNARITEPDGSITNVGPFTIVDELSLDNLAPGEYTITLSVDVDCEATCTFTIEEGMEEECDFEIVFSNAVNVLCHGDSTGSFFVDINGEFEEPLSILWAGPPIELDLRLGAFNDLPPGNYQIQVTDFRGCSASGALNIIQPMVPFTVSCESQDNGRSVRLSWSGAAGGIQYHVINLMTDDTLRNMVPLVGASIDLNDLTPGNYEVYLTDENGCQSNSCMFTILTSDCEITIDIVLTNPIRCFGDLDASLETSVLNAIGETTYSWNGPVTIPDTPNPSGLPAGIYSVTVIDDIGCEAATSITIEQPEELLLFDCTTIRPASGEGVQDGSAMISFSGGTPEYIIRRNGPATNFESGLVGGISFTAFGMESGNHIFEITDANGCTAICNVLIEIEDIECSLTLEAIEQNNPSCAGENDGSIVVLGQSDNPMSGTINYLWDSGFNNPSRTELGAGTYSVTASDALGCLDSLIITLNGPQEIEIDFDFTQADCTQHFTELTILSITGGTGAYDLLIDEENYVLPPFPQSIMFGADFQRSLTGIVTDENECSIEFTIDIESFDFLTIQPLPNVTLFSGESFEISNLEINKPIDEIELIYFFNGVQLCNPCTEDFVFRPTQSGLFRIQAIDEIGCVAEISFSITLPTPANSVYVPNAFTPNGDNVNDTFLPLSDGSVVLVNYFEIFDRWGNRMYSIENVPLDDTIGWDGTRVGSMLQPGTYIYQLEVEFEDGSKGTYSGEVILLR